MYFLKFFAIIGIYFAAVLCVVYILGQKDLSNPLKILLMILDVGIASIAVSLLVPNRREDEEYYDDEKEEDPEDPNQNPKT